MREARPSLRSPSRQLRVRVAQHRQEETPRRAATPQPVEIPTLGEIPRPGEHHQVVPGRAPLMVVEIPEQEQDREPARAPRMAVRVASLPWTK